MNIQSVDNYTWSKAEEFYADSARYNVPTSITYDPDDNNPTQACLKTGAIFRFNDNKLLLLQFVRPTLWKVTFDSAVVNASDYTDFNSRTIVQNTLTQLRETLDEFEKVYWETTLEETEDGKRYCLYSTVYPSSDALRDKTGALPGKGLRLFVEKSPFRIVAVRELPPLLDELDTPPVIRASEIVAPQPRTAIIWQTTPNGLAWIRDGETTSTILSVVKPGAARYIGFGEQGGMSLFKYSTYMNYFDYDNMMYNGVYGKGAGDIREPLYHSEPFWIEVDTHQNLKSKVATFIDNYSQISIDFGRNNNGIIRVGTKFNTMQYFVMAGDQFADIIRIYTSIVGRPRLKPRFILGYHQGCYGYDTQQKVVNIVDQYRAHDIPLDGMHIDVDLQDRYRTFTTSPEKFPDPRRMFRDLRAMGVKASTNITPVISNASGPGPAYQTLEDGLRNGYFVTDNRYTQDGIGIRSSEVAYIAYENGQRLRLDAQSQFVQYPDPGFDFRIAYNSGSPYHGGVFYGHNFGTPGHYPDLNRSDVRDWWGMQYLDLFEKGLEFVWQDMTSPCVVRERGDMKGFPFRLMLSTDVYPEQEGEFPAKKPAIEMWSLYSYNLHKATYKGLNALPMRQGKRNFIIGRGSFAGMHRYAGLWTGDNASTWDFLRISVAQVLASGLSGGSITGADVGGFMPNGNERWADPELLIRWYCAYSMLPWFRNHYHGKPGMKYFQEPYVYTDHYWNPQWHDQLKQDERMHLSVEPICRYYIELRYTLLQLLYDAMFENQISGMPIARAMILTDIYDDSLFKDASDYLYRQYMVRNDLLVCPRLLSEKTRSSHRVYLPQPDSWYVFNLRPDHNERPEKDILKLPSRVPLQSKIAGGTMMEWDDNVRLNDPGHIPYVTPMFVREGAIIPQIELRQFIPDLTNRKTNPITLHIYPGKDNTYTMYLDDGVSRASAPDDLPQYTTHPHRHEEPVIVNPTDLEVVIDEDPEAKGEFREVKIEQRSNTTARGHPATRTVTIKTIHDNYKLEDLKRDIGDTYTVVMWHDPAADTSRLQVTVNEPNVQLTTLDRNLKATVVRVPVQPANAAGVEIVCSYN